MYVMLRLTAATIALAFLLGACSPEPVSQRAGSYGTDEVITAAVEKALWQDPALRVMHIQVATYQNVVQLSGVVDRPQMRGLAHRVAGEVSGVSSVQNDLVVK
jgi:hyperosmotically inducible protein